MRAGSGSRGGLWLVNDVAAGLQNTG